MTTACNPPESFSRVYVIDHIEQIDASDWNALAQLNPTHTIFQTYEFNRAASQGLWPCGWTRFILV